MIRILIADDHAIVRQGLKQIVSEIDDMVVEDEASNGIDALNKVSERDYDVVVLDIAMPGQHGLDILRQIKKEKPRLPVLILSIYPEEQYAMRALRAGASGYLAKESAPEELISAIKEVYKGRRYVNSTLAQNLASYLDRGVKNAPHETLSDREYQVMCMIAGGKRVKEISEDLHLSVKTISTYRTRILAKMKMKSDAELIRYAIKKRLVY